MDTMPGCSYDSLKDLNTRISHSHSKKVIKHALRQQAKRRRNSTTIASSGALPRIVVTSLPPQIEAPTKASTMREVLASLPGFSVKPRRRSSKKLSAAAQLEQTKEGCIDLETPDSILVNTNLRAFLNKHTFSSLPSLYQYKLIQLLPGVDRQSATHADAAIRLSGSGLNNEFFARACHEWRERLAEGEFTPENQQKLKAEAEKEMSRLDPWKLKHFEPIWGDKSGPPPDHAPFLLTRPPLKTTIKLRQAPSRHPSKPVPRRLRTVGAVTRAITSYREEVAGAGAEKRGVDDLDDECHKKLKVTQESSVCAQVESGEERVIEIPDGQSECLDGELRSAASQEDNNNVELAFECIDKPASIPDCGPEDVLEDLCHRPEDEVTTYTGAECVDEQASVKTDAPAVEDEPGRVHDVEVIEVITKEDNDEEMDGCELTAENYYVTAASDVSEQCQDYNETQDYNEAFQGESDCYVEISDCVADKQCNDEPNVETIVDNNIQDLVVTEVEFKDDCYAYNCVEKEEEEVSLVKDPSNERREEELSEAISPAKMDVGTSYEQEQDDLNVSFKSEGTDPDHMAYEPNVEHKDDVIHESAILTTTQFLLEEDECKLETEEDPLKQVDEDDYEVVDEGDDYDEPLYVPGDTWDTADSDKLPGEHVDVEVIPMQEELEVRLEEGTFPVAEEALSMDWPYTVKMSPEGGSGLTLNEEENKKTSQAQYPEYSTSQGVKLELEVTLTPEAVSGAESLVTSTVGGGPYSSTPPTVSKASAVAVIPPTTIVCLPSAVSAPSLLHRQSPPMASNVVSAAGMAKTAVVASSSAVPYLAVNSTTPIRALPAQMPKSQAKPKSARDNPQKKSDSLICNNTNNYAQEECSTILELYQILSRTR
uniref:DEUBAD domain-containing protein n=3 Tax=Timema TaxID=61471 RepID=A0A7R9PPI9_TIMGE|nr:unnamed protein product [Timema genevievae]